MVCPGPSRSPQCLAHSRCAWHAVGAQEKTHCLNAGPAVRVPRRPARGPVSGLWLSSPRPPRARPPKDVASARHAHHVMLGPVLWPCPGPAPSSPRPLRTPSLSPGSHIRDITPTLKSPLMWGPRPLHPKTWTPQNTRGPGLSPPVSGEDGPRSPSVSVASARAAAKVRRGPEATRALSAGFRVTIQSRSLFLAKGGAPGRLPWAWGGGTWWPSRGGGWHSGAWRGETGPPQAPHAGAGAGAHRGGRSLCGSCRSRGCSCSRRPGRRRTCPARGWRRARRHSRWAAGGRAGAAGTAPRRPPPRGPGGRSAPRGQWQCVTTSHFPDTQTPRRSVSLQDVPSRAGTMSCRCPSSVVQCRSQGLLEMWT